MRKLLFLLTILLAFFSNYAFAEGVFSDDDDETRILSNYGYIVGTLNTTEWLNYYDQDDPTSMYWQPHGLENSANYGRFLHYYFWLNVGNDVYKCVIDFKDFESYDSPYRVIELNPANSSYYGNIFSATEEWHNITPLTDGYNPAEGALDYYRHPGILLDMADDISWRPFDINYDHGFHAYSTMFPVDQSFTLEWDEKKKKKLSIVRTPNDTNQYHYSAPSIAALFNNVSKIYVFGERVTDSTGYVIHNVHQYQGDRHDSGFEHKDGTFQDGAVIFEYLDGSRKLLMVKLGDHYRYGQFVSGQVDFSYDSSTSSHVSAEAAPFTYLTLSYNPLINGNHAIYGPYTATQIEAISEGDQFIESGDTDISLSFRYFNSTSAAISIVESNHPETNVEYIRSAPSLWNLHTFPRPIAPPANQYYLHVKKESGDITSIPTISIHLRYR